MEAAIVSIDPKEAFSLLKGGCSAAEIGKKLGGVSRQRIQQLLASHPPYIKYRQTFYQEELRIIKALAQRGLCADEIAAETGWKVSHVRYVSYKGEFPIPRKEKRRIGLTYGKWTVLEKLGYRDPKNPDSYSASSDKSSNLQYLCRCKCGSISAVASSNLERGISLSCASCASKARRPAKK